MKAVYNVTPKDLSLKQLSGSKTLFKKQLIRFGDWIDPIWPDQAMRIDRVFLESLVKNFKNGVPGRIPVPLTHTDNPEFNTGELVELTVEGDGTNLEDGLYGILDIRREDTADDIRNELIWDVSISFTDNYQDNENGALYGPTLLHVALVNNPYIKKMNPFTALADTLQNKFGAAVHMLSESTNKESITMKPIKNTKDFPVEVTYKDGDKDVTVTLQPGQEVEVSETQATELEKVVSEAVKQETSEEKEAREKQEAEDKAKAEQEAADAKAEEEKNLSETQKLQRDLAESQAKLRSAEIEKSYGDLLQAGKIVPAMKEAFYELAESVHGQTRQLSDEKTVNLSESLARLFESMPKIISLNDEKGKIEDDTSKSPFAKLPKESREGLQAMRITEEEYAKNGFETSFSVKDIIPQEN